MNTQQLKDTHAVLSAAMDDGSVIDAYQAAASLNVHHNVVFKACAEGKLVAYQFGRTWYMTPEAVAQWRSGMKFHRK
jgi:hypothetical protein